MKERHLPDPIKCQIFAERMRSMKLSFLFVYMLCVDMNRLVVVGAGMGKVTPGGVGNRARSFRDRMHTTRPRLYPNNLAICGDSYLIRDCRRCNIFCQCSRDHD